VFDLAQLWAWHCLWIDLELLWIALRRPRHNTLPLRASSSGPGTNCGLSLDFWLVQGWRKSLSSNLSELAHLILDIHWWCLTSETGLPESRIHKRCTPTHCLNEQSAAAMLSVPKPDLLRGQRNGQELFNN